jgi:hypothetical protein
MKPSTRTRRWLGSLLALPLLGASAAAGDGGIDFEALEKGFAERRCPKSMPCTTDAVLARDYLNLRLGAFDVFWPRAYLLAADDAASSAALLAGLVELQGGLAAWLALQPEAAAALEADLTSVRTWLGELEPSDLARAAKGDSPSFAQAARAPQPVLDALLRLAEVLMDRERLGLAPQFVPSVGLVIAPKRLEFMEWIGHLGSQDAAWAGQHWNDGASDWTQFWSGPTMFLALEYSPMTGFDPTFVGALPPEKLDKDGLRQHVLNQAARALLFRCFNEPEFAPLERALAANLVIGISGRIAVLDGEGTIKTTGASSAPYSRFVPGGLSEGGVLPPAPAVGGDSLVNCRWRKGAGADYFVAALRAGQVDGAKSASKDRSNPRRKDKLVHFAIGSDERGAEWIAHAPFLGPYAADQAYPEPEFLNDYREFFKAYQSAFYHWLETVAEPAEGTRDEAFANFLRRLGTPVPVPEATAEAAPAAAKVDIGAALEEAYGLPVSGPDGTVDSLEWRFLAWIAEAKKS